MVLHKDSTFVRVSLNTAALVCASLATISKLLSLSGYSGEDYTSSSPPTLVWLLAAASSFFKSRYFLSHSSYFPAMSKNDMQDRICALSKNDLKDLVKTYRIPLDLHPRFHDLGFTMDRLLADAIGIYFEFL
ncbi:hypothetical protein Tco_1230371, partial [Tanacetum coccineum]